jgi:microcystin-dependent protein
VSQPFVGEVRLVGFNFAPVGWSFCNGSIISISENSTLFQLIGTTYGGNGQSTFGLPNLQSRVPVHQGNGYVIGSTGGTEAVTLTLSQCPAHTHSLLASANPANSSTAAGNTVGAGLVVYSTLPPETPMNASMVGSSGGNLPHNNLQPFLALNWVISLFGIFPSQG